MSMNWKVTRQEADMGGGIYAEARSDGSWYVAAGGRSIGGQTSSTIEGAMAAAERAVPLLDEIP